MMASYLPEGIDSSFTINRNTGFRVIRLHSNNEGGVYCTYLVEADDGSLDFSYRTWFREDDLVDVNIED